MLDLPYLLVTVRIMTKEFHGMQAGKCGRCRGELGVAGRVCQHCRLDEQFVGWEVRIYSLQTHAMAAGQAVTAEEAIARVSLCSASA